MTPKQLTSLISNQEDKNILTILILDFFKQHETNDVYLMIQSTSLTRYIVYSFMTEILDISTA